MGDRLGIPGAVSFYPEIENKNKFVKTTNLFFLLFALRFVLIFVLFVLLFVLTHSQYKGKKEGGKEERSE